MDGGGIGVSTWNAIVALLVIGYAALCVWSSAHGGCGKGTGDCEL